MLSAADIAGMHTTVIGLSNASLTVIETPGVLDRYGDPGEPAAVWNGSASGFLDTASASQASGVQEVADETDTFLLFDKAGADVAAFIAGADWAAATVVIADRRTSPAVSWRYTVIGVRHEADGTLDHVLLTLNAGQLA